MASKFGGAQASKNAWVMQQNLARHKGVMSYVHKAKLPKPKVVPAAMPEPVVDAVVEPATTPAT